MKMTLNVKVNGFEMMNGNAESKNGTKLADFDFGYSFEAEPTEMQTAIEGLYDAVKKVCPQLFEVAGKTASARTIELDALNKATSAAKNLEYEVDYLRKDMNSAKVSLEEAKRDLEWTSEFREVKKNTSSSSKKKKVEESNDDPYKEV